ncbi:EamA family transporter [Segetibacter sp. 3557_3]|uniref:EamA family transporter n=1 Tax=Segetibacter sp. 3557_3 TaxID=2547429 RepID=UPI001058B5CA|nr:EamA family transporter [Segetibacter sp. 3557_3]TDH21282.1 EamA family transporter [Segetibacter sp. 3557_3]
MKDSKPSPILLVLAFTAIYFVWGTTYMANLFGLEGMKPFVLSCLRYLAAGAILSAWCIYRKLTWPDRGSIKVLVISGIIMLVGGSAMVVYAEQYISSGYAAVIIATEPLWFVLLDRKRWSAYFSNKRIIAGLLIGFAGIALFSGFSPASNGGHQDATHKLLGTIIVLVSAILWVIGTLYAKGKTNPGSSNVANTAVQLIAAGIFSGLVGIVNGEWLQFEPGEVSTRAWGGLIFLIVMGSLVAYLAFTWLVTVQPPALVSTHTYVNPIVAILIGWLVANEKIVFTQVIALVIVLTGVLLTTVQPAKLQAQTAN